MTAIRLTIDQARLAAYGGADRRLEQLYGRRAGTRDLTGNLWQMDIEACSAEEAFAIHQGVFWTPTRLPDPDGDVGAWQVRHTLRPDGGLIVKRTDRADARFVLVIGQLPVFNVIGWIDGADAMQDRFWRPDFAVPAFLVPQTQLRKFGRDVLEAAA